MVGPLHASATVLGKLVDSGPPTKRMQMYDAGYSWLGAAEQAFIGEHCAWQAFAISNAALAANFDLQNSFTRRSCWDRI
jgi:hypothetical protein